VTGQRKPDSKVTADRTRAEDTEFQHRIPALEMLD
jgi:hypothetical protein